MTRTTRLGLATLTLCLAAGQAYAQVNVLAAKAGADYLIGKQNVDGGWAWTDVGPTASNIQGATGFGVLRVYEATGGSSYLTSAKKAGDYIKDSNRYSVGVPRFATADPYYLGRLSTASGDSTWSSWTTTEFFGAQTAGTYGGPTRNWTTAGFIGAVQTGRTGTWVNLRSWEFSTLTAAAGSMGTPVQQGQFQSGILSGLDTLDNTSPMTVYSDILGVAGGVHGLSLNGTSSFTGISSPNHSGVNGISSLVGLASYLGALQNPDGSWYWHSNLGAPGLSDEDTQTTAYAVLALEAAGAFLGTGAYDAQISLGRDFLRSMQLPGGGFISYPGDTSAVNNEVTGEAVAALVPTPGTLVLLGLGGLIVSRRRR